MVGVGCLGGLLQLQQGIVVVACCGRLCGGRGLLVVVVSGELEAYDKDYGL